MVNIGRVPKVILAWINRGPVSRNCFTKSDKIMRKHINDHGSKTNFKDLCCFVEAKAFDLL